MKQSKFKQLNYQAILWFEHHIESFKTSINRNIAHPISYLFTIAMIAIALTIPIALYLLFSSSQQLTQQWDGDKQITLFLNDNVVLSQAESLAKQIDANEFVSATFVINKQQALKDFKQQMGLDGIVTELPDNPLPHLIIVQPEANLTEISSLQSLEAELSNLDQVQQVQFDLLWFERLQAILNVISQSVWLISIILLIAITLIIANVVRWEVSARHSEIEIIKLVGASDSYIRRPFLYSGFWLALGGSMLAIILTTICAWMLSYKTKHLANVFDSQFQLSTLSIDISLLIIIFISLLGVAASWFAVSHKLKQYS